MFCQLVISRRSSHGHCANNPTNTAATPVSAAPSVAHGGCASRRSPRPATASRHEAAAAARGRRVQGRVLVGTRGAAAAKQKEREGKKEKERQRIRHNNRRMHPPVLDVSAWLTAQAGRLFPVTALLVREGRRAQTYLAPLGAWGCLELPVLDAALIAWRSGESERWQSHMLCTCLFRPPPPRKNGCTGIV